MSSDPPENGFYCHSPQHQPDLRHQAPSESEVGSDDPEGLDFFLEPSGFKYLLTCRHASNPDLSRNDRWERGESLSVISNLPQTGSLERHRILSESSTSRASLLPAQLLCSNKTTAVCCCVSRRLLQNGLARSLPRQSSQAGGVSHLLPPRAACCKWRRIGTRKTALKLFLTNA